MLPERATSSRGNVHRPGSAPARRGVGVDSERQIGDDLVREGAIGRVDSTKARVAEVDDTASHVLRAVSQFGFLAHQECKRWQVTLT